MANPTVLFYSPSPAPYASKLFQLCAVDLFPRTAHVETVALLTRQG